jgi:hypothetical protein
MKTLLPMLTLGLGARIVAAPFQNLGFDEPYLHYQEYGWKLGARYLNVPLERGLPGWQLLYGGSSDLIDFHVNMVHLDVGFATVYDMFWDSGLPRPSVYGVAFQPSFTAEFELFQTGDVSAEARSVWFASWNHSWDLEIDGTPVSVRYEAGEGCADVSAWAGRTVELRFRSGFLDWSEPGSHHNTLDSIRFSTQVVPEPSTSVLFGADIGILWLTGRSRRRGSTLPI